MSEQRLDRARYALGALAGLIAALVALGVAELVAAVVRPQASPVIAVGGAVIDATPVWLKDFAIRTFGTNDKPVLIGSILLVLVMLALATGALAVRRRIIGLAGVAVLGVVGAAAAATRPTAEALDVLPSLVGAVVGSLALARLLQLLPARSGVNPASDASDASLARPGLVTDQRRRFLVAGLAMAGVGVGFGVVGRLVTGRRSTVAAARADVRLPPPLSEATPVPRGTDLRIEGLSPFRTPNKDFYRVDTALIVPQVSTDGWRLRVHGMVDKEIELDFKALLAREMVERDVTLTCVSNEVGG